MKSLKTRWGEFLAVVADPWVVLLALGTAALIVFSADIKETAGVALATTLLILASGVLGSRLTKQWVDVTEKGPLLARGKLAVRSLKLLLGNIVSMDRRVKQHLTTRRRVLAQQGMVILMLEEIRERCRTLTEEAVSSIENWTDIVPEADIKTHIGVISDLTSKLETAAVGLKRLQSDLDATKVEAQGERSRLASSIEQKEAEIAFLRNQVWQQQADFGTSHYPSGANQPSEAFGRLMELLSSGIDSTSTSADNTSLWPAGESAPPAESSTDSLEDEPPTEEGHV